MKRLSLIGAAAAVLLALAACAPPQAPAGPDPTPPRPPSAVTAVAGDGEATISWTPPTVQYGRPAISKYEITASDGQTLEVVGSETTATFTGLTNGTAYTFTVTATNADGTSQPSEPTEEITPTAAG